MSADKPYDYNQDPKRAEMSLGKARHLLGLSRSNFRTYAQEYADEGQQALSPLSVLSIAQAAYQAGTSKNFFPSLQNVGQEVVAHVKQHAPELEADVQVQVNEFLAGADEAPPIGQPAIDDSVTPPQVPDPLERTYMDLSTGGY